MADALYNLSLIINTIKICIIVEMVKFSVSTRSFNNYGKRLKCHCFVTVSEFSGQRTGFSVTWQTAGFSVTWHIWCKMIWWTLFILSLDVMVILIIKAYKSFLFCYAFRPKKCFWLIKGTVDIPRFCLINLATKCIPISWLCNGAGASPPAQHPFL